MGLATLIDRDGYRIAADSKVLKSREVSVVEDVTQAFALAERRLIDSNAANEAACEERLIEAYRIGIERGARDEATRLAIVEVTRRAILESLRPALAELVMEAVALVAKGVDRNALIAKALDGLQGSIREAGWARLRVHPSVVDAARSAVDSFTRETGLDALRVIGDEALTFDDCIFESEFGKVDAGLSVQLDSIRAAVGKAAPALIDDVVMHEC